MKHGFLIFNPSAGIRKKSHWELASVVREFGRYGIDMTPTPTQPGLSAGSLVEELIERRAPDLLVSWGGDGTINEIANGMFGHSIPLGVLPGGTANLLARELKLPLQISKAISVIGEGKTRAISVAQGNHRYFLLMAGIGFDSEVIRNVDWKLKKKLGKFAFGLAALNAARKYDFPKFVLRINGHEKEGVFAVICNAREYAAYFVLTPDADISDEYLYVCLFKDPGLPSMAKYLLHVLSRTHEKLESVEIVRATALEAVGPEKIAVQADGELIGFLPMKFSVHSRSLNVFCP